MCCMLGHAMDHDMGEAKPAGSGARPEESLIAILQRRYAQGEISGDQLAEMKRVLGIGAAPEPAGLTAQAWEGEHHG